MDDVYLTLDIDWAPDAAIDATAEILEAADCSATWFVTHETPALERLRSSDLFELGIHPNFLRGSSHGSDPAQVLQAMLEIVPDARCVRTHGAYQSGDMLHLLRDSPLELDCSVMLPGLAHAGVVAYEDGSNRIWRLPYFWSDDYEADMSSPDWELEARLEAPGIKVLDFHPIHVALNTDRMESYDALKHGAPDVSAWTADTLGSARDGPGSGTTFRRTAAAIGGSGGVLADLIPGGNG